MRIFTFSELYGPFPCEEKGCDKESFAAVLTDDQNSSLPSQTGPEAARFILDNGIGVMLCDEHLEKLEDKLENEPKTQ
ncbi:MAG TPA: hypothetical protein VJC12_03750 [Candidatus Paceibacterota bacterium]